MRGLLGLGMIACQTGTDATLADNTDSPTEWERPVQLDQAAFDDLERGFACEGGFERVFALDQAGTVRLQLHTSQPSDTQGISLLVGEFMYAIFDEDGCDSPSSSTVRHLQWTKMMYEGAPATYEASDTDTHRYVRLTDVLFTPIVTNSDAIGQQRPYGNPARMEPFLLEHLDLAVPIAIVHEPLERVSGFD